MQKREKFGADFGREHDQQGGLKKTQNKQIRVGLASGEAKGVANVIHARVGKGRWSKFFG